MLGSIQHFRSRAQNSDSQELPWWGHHARQPHLLPGGLHGHPMTPIFYPDHILALWRTAATDPPLSLRSSAGGNSPSFEPITHQLRSPPFPDLSSLPFYPLARKQFAWPPMIQPGPNSRLQCEYCTLLNSDAWGPDSPFRKRISHAWESHINVITSVSPVLIALAFCKSYVLASSCKKSQAKPMATLKLILKSSFHLHHAPK